MSATPPRNETCIPPLQLRKRMLPTFLKRRWVTLEYLSRMTGIPIYVLERVIKKQIPATHKVKLHLIKTSRFVSRKACMPVLILSCIRANWSLLKISRELRIPIRTLKYHIERASRNCLLRLTKNGRPRSGVTRQKKLWYIDAEHPSRHGF